MAEKADCTAAVEDDAATPAHVEALASASFAPAGTQEERDDKINEIVTVAEEPVFSLTEAPAVVPPQLMRKAVSQNECYEDRILSVSREAQTVAVALTDHAEERPGMCLLRSLVCMRRLMDFSAGTFPDGRR